MRNTEGFAEARKDYSRTEEVTYASASEYENDTQHADYFHQIGGTEPGR